MIPVAILGLQKIVRASFLILAMRNNIIASVNRAMMYMYYRVITYLIVRVYSPATKGFAVLIYR